jgi:hypothetical protein
MEMNNGQHSAARRRKNRGKSYRDILKNNADLRNFVASNSELQEQLDAVDAAYERAMEKARLHAPLDTLAAMALWAFRTMDSAELTRRINDVESVLDVAMADLREKMYGWEENDPPPVGACNPACSEPTPCCVDGRCQSYC